MPSSCERDFEILLADTDYQRGLLGVFFYHVAPSTQATSRSSTCLYSEPNGCPMELNDKSDALEVSQTKVVEVVHFFERHLSTSRSVRTEKQMTMHEGGCWFGFGTEAKSVGGYNNGMKFRFTLLRPKLYTLLLAVYVE